MNVIVMKFQEHLNSTNDTTVGCLHGLTTFTRLYTLSLVDGCFSITDLRLILLEILYSIINFVSFDPFQVQIFHSLVFFECLLIILLAFVWTKYNKDIYQRFLLSGRF